MTNRQQPTSSKSRTASQQNESTGGQSKVLESSGLKASTKGTCCLVEVHVDALKLQVAVAVVGAGGVNTVLIADDLQVGSLLESGCSATPMGRK
jgi:hypothetical protein